MELLTTQELDREAQQTIDYVASGQETKKEGRTQIGGGAEIQSETVELSETNNIFL